MLLRGPLRLLLIIPPLLVLIFTVWSFYDERLIALPSSLSKWRPSGQTQGLPEHPASNNVQKGHREVFSVSTAGKKYFMIDFDGQEAINPNIIPHPLWNDTWIIVAQRGRSPINNSVWFTELVCNAVFKNGALRCISPPVILPIAATPVSIFSPSILPISASLESCSLLLPD